MGPGNFRTSSHLFPIYDAQLNPSGFCVAAAPGVLHNILISKSAQNKDMYCHSSQHYSACRVPGCFDTVHCFLLSSAQATFQVQLTFFDARSQLLFSFWSGLHDVYQRSDCPASEWRHSLLLNTISQWLPKQCVFPHHESEQKPARHKCWDGWAPERLAHFFLPPSSAGKWHILLD